MAKVEPECGNCQFFRRDDGTPEEEPEGECRRHSPRVVLGMTRRRKVDRTHGDSELYPETAVWPLVQGGDWCGEYSPPFHLGPNAGGG